MRMRQVAMLLTVAGMAALPASASAQGGLTPAPPFPPLTDSLSAFGSNFAFDLRVEARSTGSEVPGAAAGKFVFDARNADIEVTGVATCLVVDGDSATFGGVILETEGTVKKEALQPGQFVEMAFGAPNRTSGLFLLGPSPATCTDELDLDDTLDPGFVEIVDR